MTTLQKTIIGATLAAAVGTGIYEARQASNARAEAEALRQQQAPLAEQIQQNLVKYLSRQYPDIRNLGTRGGPFWTLIGCEMPSILVEVSHISNAQEAQRLKTEAYRQQAAQGIYEGILAYMQSLGKG